MKLKNKTKYIIVMLILLTLTNIVSPLVSRAYNIGDDIKLRGYGSVEQHLRNRESGDYMVTTDLVRILFRRNFLSSILFK